jgi:hypothetical protein
MRYAVGYKLVCEPLEQFIKRKGGINACAGRFTRWMGAGYSNQGRQLKI